VIRTWWQVDAENSHRTWVIVAPGPSLDSMPAPIVSGFSGFPTIAVDGAAAHPGLDYQYWCCWEAPRPIHTACLERARKIRPALVTQWDAAEEWEELMELRVGTPALPLDPLVIAHHPKHDSIAGFWSQMRLDRGPSWLAAIRYALARGLARRLYLVGLDLAGEGYGLRLVDSRQRDSSEWEGRWKGERRMLAATMRRMRKLGISIERIPAKKL